MNELTPEQFRELLAAEQADPHGELREDYRTAYLIWWMFRIFGGGDDGPEASWYLQLLQRFCRTKKSKIPEPELTPGQAAAMARKGNR